MKKISAIILAMTLMFTSNVYATSTPVTVDTNPEHYSCQWNSQSTYPEMNPSAYTTVWIKFKNTGEATWYNYGDHPIRLGTSHNQDRNSPFYKHTWISENRPATLVEKEVKPGGIGTFQFYLLAPTTPGNYQEYFQPLVEGVTWMEDWGVFLNITVKDTTTTEKTTEQNTPEYQAKWNSQSAYISLKPGEAQKVWVKFKNTGTKSWFNNGDNPARLGTSHPIDRESLFAKDTWLSKNRATNLKETEVKPNGIGTFEFYVQAPNTVGEYKEYFQPVIEGKTWLNDVGLFWVFTVTNSGSTTEPTTPVASGDFELVGSNVNGKAYLDWTAYTQTQTSSNTISGYKIVRSETKTNPTYPEDWWIYLSNTSTTDYTDTTVQPGHSYYYRVGAYSSDQGIIEYTNNILITIPDTINNSADFKLTSTSQSSGVKLSWNKYTLSTQTASNEIDGYKILRSTTNSSPVYPDNNLLYISGASNTVYIDTGAINGQKYYYRIGAYKNGAVVAYSNVSTITAQTNKYETGESINLYAANQYDGIKLYWNEYTTNTIDGYKVMRSTTNPTPTYPNEYFKYLSGYTNTVFTDDNTTQNQGYYYRIGAYKDGNILSYSNTIYIISDHDNTANDLTLEAVNVNGGISLTWSQYEDDSISGYKILRSTTNSNPTYNGTYYKYMPSASSIGYVDTGAVSGQRYYYRIGVYRNGDVIAYSNTVDITAN